MKRVFRRLTKVETRLPFEVQYWLRKNKHDAAAWDKLTNDEFQQVQDFIRELEAVLDLVITSSDRFEAELPSELLELPCEEFYESAEVRRLLTGQELRTLRKFPDCLEFLTDEELEALFS